jgi:isopentenyl diphosphate isomerase/L-lactate dehydrogenase-like FMN-dependent dehydrogenase
VTARANVEDLAALRILPRPLVDVGEIDVSTSVLGRPIAMPLVGAPTGLTALIHHHGEPAVARACAQAGTIYVASTMASYAIEEIRAATDGPLWFQLYVMRDRGHRPRPAAARPRIALRGARADGRHAAARLARARSPQRLHDPAAAHHAGVAGGAAPARVGARRPARGSPRTREPGRRRRGRASRSSRCRSIPR